MSHDLPQALSAAIASMMGTSRERLQAGSAALSETYRHGGVSRPGMNFAAYLAARLPATFAAVEVACQTMMQRWPEFSPTSMIDAGSGPGTASWAATARWHDIAKMTLVDNNEAFLDLARNLARHGPPSLCEADFVKASLIAPLDRKADLVMASYALAELSTADATTAVRNLWQATDQALLIVEPGTPHGFDRVRAARSALIEAGAKIIAPCPGNRACPMEGTDWCHFTVRLPRRRIHMQAKMARVPFEDEPFSYLIATRGQGQPAASRILAWPRVTKADITAKLCTGEGLNIRRIARRSASSYKQARKWEWGGEGPESTP